MKGRQHTAKEAKALAAYLDLAIEGISETPWSKRTGMQHCELAKLKEHRRFMEQKYGLMRDKLVKRKK